MFNTSQSNGDAIPLVSTTFTDADNLQSDYRLRKLEALKLLKAGNQEFIRYPSGNSPERLSYNPRIWAVLWPTLFPYGVGTFEDTALLSSPVKGQHVLKLKLHVKRYLELSDLRFQEHPSFIFVMSNVLQRRSIAYHCRLAVDKASFSTIKRDLAGLSTDDFGALEEKIRAEKNYRPANNAEKRVFRVLRHVQYIGHTHPGSTSSITTMREEIRATSRLHGLPHIFLTLNPADAHNPIRQFMAGQNIDLDQPFSNSGSPDVSYEKYERSKSLAQNPVAGAKFFNFLTTRFIDVLLGWNRKNREGLFGPVRSYYGVVEAQGRGSLHIHMLIWLENGLSPKQVRGKLKADDRWRRIFINWLDDIIKKDFPDGTIPNDLATATAVPVMSQPLPLPGDQSAYAQELRDILECTGQRHQHNATCYKHLPRNYQTLSAKDKDLDCRFSFSFEKNDETYFDDEQRLHMKSVSGNVNGYSPLIVLCCRCNMDVKYIGSGTAAQAMYEYVTNYIAKVSVESSVLFSSLAASLSSVDQNVDADQERTRLFILKSCNAILGRTERSAQQVASTLLSYPERYTPETFEMVYWTEILKYLCPGVLSSNVDPDHQDSGTEEPYEPDRHSSDIDEPDDRTQQDSYNPDPEASSTSDFTAHANQEVSTEYVTLTPDVISSNCEEPPVKGILNDLIFRPPELEKTCMWDLVANYQRCSISACSYHFFPWAHNAFQSLAEKNQTMKQATAPSPCSSLRNIRNSHRIASRNWKILVFLC